MQLDFETVSKYGGIDFFAKQPVEGFIIGRHKSPFQGFSVEFSEHKAYSPGESTKNIDWKLFARTDKLYKKVYEEETNLRCYIIVDTSSSMHYPFDQENTKLNYACYAAAALISILNAQRDAASLVTFDKQINEFTKAKTSSLHINYLLEQLKKTSKSKELNRASNIVTTLHQVAQQIPKRSLVVVFSDVIFQQKEDKVFYDALLHLKHFGHETILFNVFDGKTEYDFFNEKKPIKLIDLETDDTVKINPSQSRNEIAALLQNHKSEIKINCKKYRTDLIEVDINKPFDQVILPYFLKRSK